MKNVRLGDFLTEQEITLCVTTARTIRPSSSEFVNWVEQKVIQPNINRINKSLDQENDTRCLAYAVAWAVSQGVGQ